ncbi:hypothetical protein I3843_06G049600 [Carya illinoinensis]|uniref:S-adenosylmethionine-dependent methyltransferase n=1 Tax=Carya illinoinensis TaxID=32201 RepID=A0A8T1Q899_CARIL|nr:loganic acid O-methyltransferase-like isoform X1 [Carya illinoinensis]KAG6618155.1 hypothetical protein I3842_Q124700 [Carya illinoinensis]KAG6650595.1 hypothetical protein CIPAW_06G054500 [Carya illinoinensis]KAG7974442.1 hypothetical protein I3843_06G049600 [Carya illinoinensis]
MDTGDGAYIDAESLDFKEEARKESMDVAKVMIDDAIAEKLDVKKFSFTSKSTFRIADLGCSVGPNTFNVMQNIIDAVQHKCQSQGLTSRTPEFQVFFNDIPSNNFNTLFTTLPPERPYFAAGVPGSFHGRLFPESSLHFVHSFYALHFLSEVPKELLNKNSPAWNKGRISYTCAQDEVAHAYAAQFAEDMATFFDARAKELVVDGIMVLIMPAIPNVGQSSVHGLMSDCLGSSLMDMAKEGLISEAQVDLFNLPFYITSPKEMREIVEGNGCFRIEKMEIQNPRSGIDAPITGKSCVMQRRAGLEGMISKHFGAEIVDDLFYRFSKKIDEVSNLMESQFQEGTQLSIVLKRI